MTDDRSAVKRALEVALADLNRGEELRPIAARVLTILRPLGYFSQRNRDRILLMEYVDKHVITDDEDDLGRGDNVFVEGCFTTRQGLHDDIDRFLNQSKETDMITRYFGLAVPHKLAQEIDDCADCKAPDEPLGMPTFCEKHLKALEALRAADREARMKGKEIRATARAEEAERFLQDSTVHLDSVVEMARKLGGEMVHYSDGFVEVRDIPLLDGLRVEWTYDVYRMLNAAIQGHGHYQALCDEIALRTAAEDDGEVIDNGG